MKAEKGVREYQDSLESKLVWPRGWCRSGVNNEKESEREAPARPAQVFGAFLTFSIVY